MGWRNNGSRDNGFQNTDQPNRLVRKGRVIAALGCVLWAMALLPGARSLMTYETTPGLQGEPPASWPADVDFDTVSDSYTGADTGAKANIDAHRNNDQSQEPTLVVALHPRCTCSRATLTELEEAAAGFHHPYRAVLLIYRPRESSARSQTAWQTTGLYREAQLALHARVIDDTDGLIAARFGARTSGEILLYSGAPTATGRLLLFAGGITPARGETGDNRGLAALTAAFERTSAPVVLPPASAPVYGCSLVQPARQSRGGR